MRIFRDFRLGISSYFKAISFINRHKMNVYFILPLLLNILLFMGGLSFVNDLTDKVSSILLDQVEEWLGRFSWIVYIKDAAYVLIWIIFKLVYLMLFAFFGGFIVITMMSPLMAYLSEKTEKIITGNEYRFNPIQFIRDILRGVYLASRNLLIEIGYVVLFFILGFIPGINLLSPIGLFIVSCYFYGFSFMDYSVERKKGPVSKGVKYIRNHRGIAIGNGFVFSIFLIIPYVGVFLASMVSIISVVAATISVLEKDGYSLSSS